MTKRLREERNARNMDWMRMMAERTNSEGKFRRQDDSEMRRYW